MKMNNFKVKVYFHIFSQDNLGANSNQDEQSLETYTLSHCCGYGRKWCKISPDGQEESERKQNKLNVQKRRQPENESAKAVAKSREPKSLKILDRKKRNGQWRRQLAN